MKNVETFLVDGVFKRVFKSLAHAVLYAHHLLHGHKNWAARKSCKFVSRHQCYDKSAQSLWVFEVSTRLPGPSTVTL